MDMNMAKAYYISCACACIFVFRSFVCLCLHLCLPLRLHRYISAEMTECLLQWLKCLKGFCGHYFNCDLLPIKFPSSSTYAPSPSFPPLQSAAVACSPSRASLAAQMPPLVAGPGRYLCANGAHPPTCTSAERRCSTRTGQSQRLIVLTSKLRDFLQSTTDQQLISN